MKLPNVHKSEDVAGSPSIYAPACHQPFSPENWMIEKECPSPIFCCTLLIVVVVVLLLFRRRPPFLL